MNTVDVQICRNASLIDIAFRIGCARYLFSSQKANGVAYSRPRVHVVVLVNTMNRLFRSSDGKYPVHKEKLYALLCVLG